LIDQIAKKRTFPTSTPLADEFTVHKFADIPLRKHQIKKSSSKAKRATWKQKEPKRTLQNIPQKGQKSGYVVA